MRLTYFLTLFCLFTEDLAAPPGGGGSDSAPSLSSDSDDDEANQCMLDQAIFSAIPKKAASVQSQPVQSQPVQSQPAQPPQVGARFYGGVLVAATSVPGSVVPHDASSNPFDINGFFQAQLISHWLI